MGGCWFNSSTETPEVEEAKEPVVNEDEFVEEEISDNTDKNKP